LEVEFHAELSNHLHLVIRTRPDIVVTWSDAEVVRRMLSVHKIIHSKDGHIEPPSIGEIQLELADPERVAELRGRLKNLSWLRTSPPPTLRACVGDLTALALIMGRPLRRR
jgi:hypothetical protein